jgi:tellurite resistance protein TerC
MPFREALRWSGLWVGLAAIFGVLVWLWLGGASAGEYAAGYLIEWSLSVDNVFVFILIFAHFSVPPMYQHRVLFWGVLGAVVTRLSFILAGSALLNRFHWVIYVFGAILVVTAIRFLRERERERSLEENVVLRITRRLVPMTEELDGPRLTMRRDGRWMATPLLAVLVLIEATDIVFAVDSIPAVFAVTKDAFIAFTSNAMAILGLRSLYFVMAGAIDRFRYLKPALAAVLAFVGVKMLLSEVVHVPVLASLAVIVAIMGVAGVASARTGARVASRDRGPGAA